MFFFLFLPPAAHGRKITAAQGAKAAFAQVARRAVAYFFRLLDQRPKVGIKSPRLRFTVDTVTLERIFKLIRIQKLHAALSPYPTHKKPSLQDTEAG